LGGEGKFFSVKSVPTPTNPRRFEKLLGEMFSIKK
jgi:hypothetical protein